MSPRIGPDPSDGLHLLVEIVMRQPGNANAASVFTMQLVCNRLQKLEYTKVDQRPEIDGHYHPQVTPHRAF